MLYDYLCLEKSFFMNRMHKVDRVYSFSDELEVPKTFKQLGVHKEKVTLEAQLSALRGEVIAMKREISTLKGRMTKLTGEK